MDQCREDRHEPPERRALAIEVLVDLDRRLAAGLYVAFEVAHGQVNEPLQTLPPISMHPAVIVPA